jgi:hypothetical protein
MQHDLQDLDRAISEEEIHAAIMHSASEKSPGPDGYIGAFYKVCWGIIKSDLIAVIKEIFELRLGCWNLLNSAHVVLIEKRKMPSQLVTIGLLVYCIVRQNFWQRF